MYKSIIKNLLDFCGALILLILLLPLFLVIAVIIKRDGDVFFRQERVGKCGKVFRIYKFRTMTQADRKVLLTTSASEITPIGQKLRKYHIDELPQLINVLKGEMSLVGPRPEVPKYVDMNNQRWKEVLSVKPGITGLASLELSRYEYETLAKSEDPESDYLRCVLPKKLLLDGFYAKKTSFIFDVKIMVQTVLMVLA